MNSNEKFLCAFSGALAADRYAVTKLIDDIIAGRNELDIIKYRMRLSIAMGKLLFTIESTYDWRTNGCDIYDSTLSEFRDAIFDFMLVLATYSTKLRLTEMREKDSNVRKHPLDMSSVELQVKEFNKIRNKLCKQLGAIIGHTIENSQPYTAWIVSREREGLSANMSDEERSTGAPRH